MYDHRFWLVITNKNIQVNSHEFTEHLPCGRYMCDLVSQISRHSRLCWDIWLHVKLEHIHRHLMAGIKSYVILLELVTSLLVTPTLSSTSVSPPVYANRLVLLYRWSPRVPTESRLCRKTPDRTDTVHMASLGHNELNTKSFSDSGVAAHLACIKHTTTVTS